jgi:O-antigen ligase
MVQGPTDHPLELVGVLVMMFPLALIGVLRSDSRRNRILYGLAACLLMGAMVATDRKSALLAPLAVFLVVGYHYRGKLLRLAPLLLALVVAVHALSPGALGTVVDQLNPSNLGVSTVSDRTSDYDAVRPDLWSHLAFGRGYGTYDHINYRTLDSDILNRLVDTGILGICAFIFMLLCIISVSRRMMRSRDPAIEAAALAVAASAVAYFVLCFLFDVSSFPHVPYILFSLAGLVAAGESELGQARTPTERFARNGHPRIAVQGNSGATPVPALSGRALSHTGAPDSRRISPPAPGERRFSHRSRSR